MSVYTPVSAAELQTFLCRYTLGELLEHRGISAGIGNTNYFVTTTQGDYVLTLFEEHNLSDIHFFLDLMQHLSAADPTIPVAEPQRARDGSILQTLNEKPAALIERVKGENLFDLNNTQCAAIGDALARIHVSAQQFAQQRPNPYDHAWRQATAELIRSHLPDNEQALLDRIHEQTRTLDLRILPRGIAHTDLFRDNALFHQGKLSAVLDFYDSATESWLYDLAIVVNDWCCHPDGSLDPAKLQSCIDAYHIVRPLTPAETEQWHNTLLVAALRFWLSRWASLVTPRKGDMVLQKDPAEFRNKLLARCEESDKIRACLPNTV